MQIVIDIPEEIYDSACATNNIWNMRMAGFVCSAIASGTPLSKGHGRLIDADNISFSQFFDAGDYAQARRGIYEAPTIIEADKESEGEE